MRIFFLKFSVTCLIVFEREFQVGGWSSEQDPAGLNVNELQFGIARANRQILHTVVGIAVTYCCGAVGF